MNGYPKKRRQDKGAGKCGCKLETKNTRFFYTAPKVRQSRNHIYQLLSDTGDLISKLDEIKTMAPNYYQNLFNQSDYCNMFPRVW